jgi:hypothetical protein
MESVLSNLNALNRSLEGVIAVGKEFEGVSELWQVFYSTINEQKVDGEKDTNDQ